MSDVLSYLSKNHELVTAWTAIAALFVSIVSIVLTLITVAMQRTHNRKSVMPIGHITVGDYENRISVKLGNDGVGPMIIERVTVTSEDQTGASRLALIDFMPPMPGTYSWTTFVRDISDRAISPEKEISLILLEGDPTDPTFVKLRQSVREALSKLTIKVEYRNIYGEQMSAVIRRLDWFGRNL